MQEHTLFDASAPLATVDVLAFGGKLAVSWDPESQVTNDGTLDAASLSQLYRDRGDCENNFDEHKNQYGWGGFVTKNLKPCRAIARLVAVVANWWNVFCRLADGAFRRELSRPARPGVDIDREHGPAAADRGFDR